jgi:hypothetical protein
VAPAQGVQPFEAVEEPLPGRQRLPATRGGEPVTREDVAALDRFGRLPAGAVHPGADMLRLGQHLSHGLDVGPVVIGNDLGRPAARVA